jgi:hypothetical protein
MDSERSGPFQPEDEHWHYRRFREEHARQLDDEYQQWRSQRTSGSFDEFRRTRSSDPLGQRDALAPRREGALQSLGRAVSETVTGTRQPDLDEAADPEATERFFERS